MARDEERRRRAKLSFAEKLKILEKLRDRSLVIAKSRENLKRLRQEPNK